METETDPHSALSVLQVTWTAPGAEVNSDE